MGAREFFYKDHLGSTRQLERYFNNTDMKRDYFPFGENYLASGDGTNYQFTGKELDSETQLYYFGARYYDARIGRWLVPDAFAEKNLQWSPYVYCFNNPLTNIDPTGMQGGKFDDDFSWQDDGTGEKRRSLSDDNLNIKPRFIAGSNSKGSKRGVLGVLSSFMEGVIESISDLLTPNTLSGDDMFSQSNKKQNPTPYELITNPHSLGLKFGNAVATSAPTITVGLQTPSLGGIGFRAAYHSVGSDHFWSRGITYGASYNISQLPAGPLFVNIGFVKHYSYQNYLGGFNDVSAGAGIGLGYSWSSSCSTYYMSFSSSIYATYARESYRSSFKSLLGVP